MGSGKEKERRKYTQPVQSTSSVDQCSFHKLNMLYSRILLTVMVVPEDESIEEVSEPKKLKATYQIKALR